MNPRRKEGEFLLSREELLMDQERAQLEVEILLLLWPRQGRGEGGRRRGLPRRS